MSGFILIIASIILVLAMGVIGFAIFGAWRVFHPKAARSERLPKDVGLNETAVRFPAQDGRVTLAGWVFKTSNPVPKHQTIVLCHQWGAQKSFLLRHVLAYSERGYDCLVFDLRNHGDSDRFSKLRPQSQFFTSDVRGAIRFAQNYAGFAGNEIILHGFSFSTFPVSVACTHEEGQAVDRVILECGPTHTTRQILEGFFDTIGAKFLPAFIQLPIVKPLFKHSFRICALYLLATDWPSVKLGGLTIPGLLITGSTDMVARTQDVLPLSDLIKTWHIVEIEKASHLNANRANSTQYWHAIDGFLDKKELRHLVGGTSA